jgi:hypothetical protein
VHRWKCRNILSWVFAVGDVSNPDHPCTATAIAAGTVAARSIQKRIEALDTLSDILLDEAPRGLAEPANFEGYRVATAALM